MGNKNHKSSAATAGESEDTTVVTTGPQTVNRQIKLQSTSSSTNQASTIISHAFERAMIQPCLVILFEFFTIAERLAAQSISKEWMRIARLRRFWSNYQYSFPGGYFESWTQMFDRRAPDPAWLCQSLGGLTISFKELIRPQTFSQMIRFNQITQLEINNGGYSDITESITLEEGRTGLKQLRLTSFSCGDFPSHSLITDMVFGTAEEIASNLKQTVESSPSHFHGVLFAWCTTLERFRITSSHNSPTIAPHHLFTLMSKSVVWPELTHYHLTHGKLSFDSDSLHGLGQLFTRHCLPNLVVLEFRVVPMDESINQAATVLNESMKQEFYDLQEIDISLGSRLTGSPPLQLCFQSLTSITIAEEMSIAWLTAIRACENLSHLLIQGTIHPDVNQFNFFQAIHQLPIRSLELHFFYSSSFSLSSEATGTRICPLLSNMASLTQLTLIHFRVDLPYQQNDWLFFLHHFPQLATVSCTFDSNAGPVETATSKDGAELLSPQPPPPTPTRYAAEMLSSISRITNLTSLTLSEFRSKDLEEFNRAWLKRINVASNNGAAAPIPLCTLHLRRMYLNSDAPPHMFQLVGQLRHFTRLTDLTIQVTASSVGEGHSFYRDLDQCRSLRSLRILGCMNHSQHCIDDDTLLHWCSDGSMINESVPEGYWGRLVDGSATRFPKLELLEFDHVMVKSIASLYALPRLRQLYWSGHRGHSNLYEWMSEKNRQLMGLPLKDPQLYAPVLITSKLEAGEISHRPPMHLGHRLPVKIDRIQRMLQDATNW